jgi:hypothetical protein
MKRPPELYLLYFLHFFIGVNALIGGVSLMVKKDGSLLGMKPDWLKGTPFADYFIPGLLLLLLLGVLPLVVLTGLVLKKWKAPRKLLVYPDTFWAWTGSLLIGIVLFTWIMVQLLLTRYFILQPMMLAVASLIILITLLPRVMRFYTNGGRQ